MSLSDTTEGYLIDWLLSLASPTAPATVYVALSTADPGEAGGSIAEPSGNGYARVASSSSDWSFISLLAINLKRGVENFL